MKNDAMTAMQQEIVMEKPVHNSFGNTICKVLVTDDGKPIISIVERHCKTEFQVDEHGDIHYLTQE